MVYFLNNIYIINIIFVREHSSPAKWPSPSNVKMVIFLNKLSTQLRLDFITFVITGPSTQTTTSVLNAFGKKVTDASQCLTDTFTVTSSTGSVPIICGTVTDDHSQF